MKTFTRNIVKLEARIFAAILALSLPFGLHPFSAEAQSFLIDSIPKQTCPPPRHCPIFPTNSIPEPTPISPEKLPQNTPNLRGNLSPRSYPSIFVAQPRVRDEIAIQERLNRLSSDLDTVRVINGPGLAGSVGNISGSLFAGRSFSLQATNTTTPSVQAPATSSTDLTAPTPSLPPLQLLLQQISLQQNIEMQRELLRPSFDDLYYVIDGKAKTEYGRKRQAFISFPVTINPTGDLVGCVAEVEFVFNGAQIRGGATQPGTVEVLAQMPSSNSYNVVATTQNTRNIGLGAIITPINLGVGGSKNTRTDYIVQDRDAIAMRGPVPPEVSTHYQWDPLVCCSLAWQFRPVLGAKIVSPGTRELLVLLSLPYPATVTQELQVAVWVRWRRYDPKRGTVGAVVSQPIAPQKFPITIFGTDIKQMSRPTFSSVIWDAGIDGTVSVEARGTGFSPASQVAVGGRILSGPTDVAVKNGDILQFKMSLAELVAGVVPRLLDPSASSRPILDTRSRDKRIQILDATMTPVSAAEGIMKIKLGREPENGSTNPILQRPLVQLGDNTVVGPGQIEISIASEPMHDPKTRVQTARIVQTLTFIIPLSAVKRTSGFTVSDPLRGFAPTYSSHDGPDEDAIAPVLYRSNGTFKDLTPTAFTVTGVTCVAATTQFSTFSLVGSAFAPYTPDNQLGLNMRAGSNGQLLPSTPSYSTDSRFIILNEKEALLRLTPQEVAEGSIVIINATKDEEGNITKKAVLLPLNSPKNPDVHKPPTAENSPG